MNTVDKVYCNLILNILLNGTKTFTRGSWRKRINTVALSFSSTPLVSVRRTAWKNALREWEWFMSGSSYVNDLHENVQSWWLPWINEIGAVDNNYSEQFRDFHGESQSVDQIKLFMDGICEHPYSTRNVITTWNTADMVAPETKITNCHGTVIQAFVDDSNTLDLTMYQRSADVICGLPHNWIQYWAFHLFLCYNCGRNMGTFNWIGGDVHIYDEHLPLAEKILNTLPHVEQATPILDLAKHDASYNGVEEFHADDFQLIGDYKPVLTDRAKLIV